VAAHPVALYASQSLWEGPYGGRRFGSGSGGGGALPVDRSLAPQGGVREGEDLSRGATGSVGDFAIRLVQRTKTPTHELTPPESKRRRPSGENRDLSRLARSAPTDALLEVGNAFTGYPALPRVFTVPNPVRACWATGGKRRGDQAGESQALENGWIQRVLVDNKSVAEIGEKHLVCLGSTRFGEWAHVRPARPGVPSP
jgi:hypothetical protein